MGTFQATVLGGVGNTTSESVCIQLCGKLLHSFLLATYSCVASYTRHLCLKIVMIVAIVYFQNKKVVMHVI